MWGFAPSDQGARQLDVSRPSAAHSFEMNSASPPLNPSGEPEPSFGPQTGHQTSSSRTTPTRFRSQVLAPAHSEVRPRDRPDRHVGPVLVAEPLHGFFRLLQGSGVAFCRKIRLQVEKFD